MMKVIIAGSRTITQYGEIAAAIMHSGFEITEVVSGNCRGVDQMGEAWAKHHNIPVKIFAADWGLEGDAAGPIRNGKMAEYADALIAIWDGKSRGTQDMMGKMAKAGKPYFVRMVD